MQIDHISNRDQPVHEPASYWQKAVSHLTLSTDLPPRTDVAIIGGGILGAAICYWLAQTGMQVVLLERTAPAFGATGRNGGFVSIGPAESYPAAIARLGHETARRVLQLTLENQMLLRRVLAEEGIHCDYHERGVLSLACSEEQYACSAQDVAALQADGIAAQMLDREQVQELVRTPLGRGIIGGKFFPEQGGIQPVRLVQGLLNASKSCGARACAARVVHLDSDGGGVRVQTEQGVLEAETVVVAVNAWTGELLPSLARLITPVRGQMLAYAPLSPVFPVGMSASVTTSGEYWQQTADGTIVLGGCRAVAPEGDVGVRVSQPTAEVQEALEQVLPGLFPSLQGLQVMQRWAGLMAFTPDYLPIVDRVPDMPGTWVVGGFSGHGMPFSMRVGQLVAEAVTRRRAPTELEPFRLDRATLRASERPFKFGCW